MFQNKTKFSESTVTLTKYYFGKWKRWEIFYIKQHNSINHCWKKKSFVLLFISLKGALSIEVFKCKIYCDDIFYILCFLF